jgi:ferredoxin-NADP reductase
MLASLIDLKPVNYYSRHGSAPKNSQGKITIDSPAGDSIHFGRRVSASLPVDPPLNLHTKQNPFDATVVSVETLKPSGGNVPPSQADAFKLVLNLSGSNFVTEDGTRARLLPGQHLMVMPQTPKHLAYLKPFKKMPYLETAKLKLNNDLDREYLHEKRYSIADMEEGENGVKVTLVIKRIEYTENGQKRLGLVSNQLASLKPGDKITVFGPNTNRFLMPPDRDANMLIFATGIAAMGPMYDFFQTRFHGQKGELGETRFYAGYRQPDDEMCQEEYQAYAKDPAKRFTYHAAFSRDPKNPQRIENLIRKDGEKILNLLDKDNTYIYICGVWGLEVSVISAMLQAALEQKRPIEDVMDRIQELKKAGRWKVEGSRQWYRYV